MSVIKNPSLCYTFLFTGSSTMAWPCPGLMQRDSGWTTDVTW